MVGKKESSDKLNATLIKITKILNENSINGWFISYGTLLGIVRENSCIDGDDDVDIIINKRNYDKLRKVLVDNNFELGSIKRKGSEKYILKPRMQNYSSIDIYMADFENGNVYDLWNTLNIKDCFLDDFLQTFLEMKWRGTTLYLPNNYKRILENRYGKSWHIKYDGKVKKTMNQL
jgi:phosphorylcholine metabolism protein LicD